LPADTTYIVGAVLIDAEHEAVAEIHAHGVASVDRVGSRRPIGVGLSIWKIGLVNVWS